MQKGLVPRAAAQSTYGIVIGYREGDRLCARDRGLGVPPSSASGSETAKAVLQASGTPIRCRYGQLAICWSALETHVTVPQVEA